MYLCINSVEFTQLKNIKFHSVGIGIGIEEPCDLRRKIKWPSLTFGWTAALCMKTTTKKQLGIFVYFSGCVDTGLASAQMML